jgi:hypothetical protein
MRKLLLIPLLLAAGACDGGSATGGAELTAAEAAQLSRAMFGMVAGLGSGVSGASLNQASRDLEDTFSVPIDETVPCTPSGSIAIRGTMSMSFNDVSGQLTMQGNMSAAPAACAHRMENGDIIKVTGDPDLDVEITMAGDIGGKLGSLQVKETGAFKWTRGGSSGRCTVDLASALNAATQVVTVSGTFCGFPVSESYPLTDV